MQLNRLILLITITPLFLLSFFTHSQINKKTVTIKNNIKRKDASKTKFFMRHYPEKFTVTINGKELAPNEKINIVIPNKKFSVQYSYVWNAPWGKITGTKQVNYQLTNQDAKTIELGFTSWDDEYRIKATGAQPTGVRVIESSGNRKKPKNPSTSSGRAVAGTAE